VIKLFASSAAERRAASLDVNLEFSTRNDTSRSAAEAHRHREAARRAASQTAIAYDHRLQ